MLSVAEPPDPSCSCEVPALKSDERAHPPERSSSPEADPAGHDVGERPRFSIRDYVSGYRSKDIRTNWPFPQRHFQLCLKYGVIDLLPPFEPPDLLRTQLGKKCKETKHLFVCSEAERTQPEADLVGSNPADLLDAVSDSLKHDCNLLICWSGLGGSSHQLQDPLTSDKLTAVQAVGSAYEDRLICEEAESKVTVHIDTRDVLSSVCEVPGSVQEATSISGSLSEFEAAKPLPWAEKVGSLCEPSVKKCRLIVKFGGASLPNQSEDIVSNLSSVSDPMALKICPVCKIFSSTSNTTLNAHIDQCLSVESSAKQVVFKFSQHKVKPRKKRSMEDICATAPHCTLEHLDRRNGTNWALELNTVAQNNEVSSTNENKRVRNSPVKPTDIEIERAVYVDSNGTKLLILSKFNDAPPATVVNCPVTKEFEKECGDKQTPLFCKKKTFSPKHRRYLKAKVQRNKISSFNHLKGKIHKEDKFPLDTHQEEEMISQASNVQGQIKAGKPRTLGQWISSKRSSLLKHSNRKISQEKPGNQLAITHQISVDDDQSAPCDYYAIGGCSEKLCRSSGEVLSSKKIRSTVMLSNAVLSAGNQKNCSSNLPQKNNRSKGKNPSTSNSISTRKCGSSAKSRRVEIHANVEEQSTKFLKSTKCFMGHHPQVHKAKKDSRRSLLMDGPQCPKETIQCNEVVQGMVSTLRKRRFAGKAHKRVEHSPSAFVERFHGSPSACGLDSASNNVTSEIYQSNLPENIMRSETCDTFKHMPPYKSNMRDSNQADVQYHASCRGESLTLNRSHTVAECHHDEPIEIDAQTEVSANMDSVIKYFLEKPDGRCSSKIVVSENHEATTCDRLDSCPSLEYPRETSSVNEATTVTSTPELLADHGMFHGVIASDVVTESSVKDDYCSEIQKMEYRADVPSILVSGTCLSRPGDKVLGIDRSPMNLSMNITSQIHNMVIDAEPSGSPVSATSTISHLSVEDLKSYDADREPSEEPVVIQEMPRSGSGNLGFLAKDSIKGTRRTDLEKTTRKMKALASSLEPEKFWHGQLCCCSQRESMFHMPKILRQSVMAGVVLPTKTKQMASSLCIRPVMPLSPAYSHSRSEMAALSILNSPPHSISGIASPDLAMRFSTFNGSANPSSHIRPQATSPVLRLMGKNLIVNREERLVQLQNRADPCTSVGTSNAKYPSLLGFSSTGCFSNQGEVQYHPRQLLEDSMVVGQQPSDMAPVPLPEGIACSAGSLLQSVLNTKTDSHAHQNTMDKKPSFSGVYDWEKVCPPHERQKPNPVIQVLIPEREVIMIDDSSEHEPEPSQSTQNPASTMAPTFSGLDVRCVRAVPCYPSQNLFHSRELGRDLKPGFPIAYPMISTNPTKWGSTSGSSDILQRPFVVPSLSAGPLTTTLCYSPRSQ